MECELKKTRNLVTYATKHFCQSFLLFLDNVYIIELCHSFLYSTLAVLDPKVDSTMNRFCEYVRQKSTLAILSFVENKDLSVISTVCAGESGLLVLVPNKLGVFSSFP